MPQTAAVGGPPLPLASESDSGTLTSFSPVRPPLKWAGGKRWQIPHLRPFWERHEARRLVEPFCGGLAVAVSLAPTRALLNDVNPHVVNLYRWLKRGFAPSAHIEMSNDAETYYRSRKRFNALLRDGLQETAEAAALFYYLNRTGYNGLCRFNQQGEFNVPFGRHKRFDYKTDFSEYVSAFAAFEFTNLDFEAIELRPEDFVYADPPYDVDFRQYSQNGFGWEEQVRTAEWLAKHSGPVILSNQATARIEKLYRKLGYTLTTLKAPRLISCKDRAPAKELLATRHL